LVISETADYHNPETMIIIGSLGIFAVSDHPNGSGPFQFHITLRARQNKKSIMPSH
jgi:hypothetical protein